MGEKRSGSEELPKLTISHDYAIRDPAVRPQYNLQRQAHIDAGEPTWRLRGFDTDDIMEPGMVLDYYVEKDKRGFIDGDDKVGFYNYQLDPYGIPQQMNTEPYGLRAEAQSRLEAAVAETAI